MSGVRRLPSLECLSVVVGFTVLSYLVRFDLSLSLAMMISWESRLSRVTYRDLFASMILMVVYRVFF